MHAVGQGALAIEVRMDDTETRKLISAINDKDSLLCCLAERAFLKTLVCILLHFGVGRLYYSFICIDRLDILKFVIANKTLIESLFMHKFYKKN